MSLRKLQRPDLDALLDLYTHLHAADEPLAPRERVLEVWEQLLASTGLSCLGLELDGLLVASCTLCITPNLTRGTRPYAQIENVVTRSEYRRRGLGKTIIQAALAQAWSAGCYKVMLMTGRRDAHAFYEQCGFRSDAKTGFVAYP